MATHADGHHDEVKHDYHLVDPSPWPFVGSMAAFVLTVGAVMWMHGAGGGAAVFFLGLAGVLVTMVGWWREVLLESKAGQHKPVVNSGLRLGMALFITSEVLFFFAFFWAFFWGALVQPHTVPTAWPPLDVVPVPPLGIPLLNTLILLASGTSLTWAHHAIREGDQKTGFKALLLTVGLGAVFMGFQVYEYIHAYHEGLTLQSGVYGSTFYMATGFHGFHVLVGTIFLAVCTFRAAQLALKPEKHVGFEAAAWYWHFVDVVWLFLFVSVYLWGYTHQVVTNPAITF